MANDSAYSSANLFKSRNQQHRRAGKTFHRLPEVDAIKDRIHASCLVEFCQEFLPNGRREGHYWRVGDVANTPGKSFTMRLTGAEAGLGFDWATGEKFDIIDVIGQSRRLPRAEAIALARFRLGHPVESFDAYTEKQKSPEELAREAEKKAKDIAAAAAIWNQCDDVLGTAAETYLRRRGIDQTLPMSLRFHPRLDYWDVNDDGNPVKVGQFPALVCMVQQADGSFCGIQRIYLATDGSGKAPVRSPKKAYGSIIGGAVRCCDDDDIRGEVGITEGIEDALSIPHLYDGKPAWAAVSAAGMAGILLPAYITHPVFFPDNDPPKRAKDGTLKLNRDGKPAYAGRDAAADAVYRLSSDVCFPRISLVRGGKDANAVLMAENGLVL